MLHNFVNILKKTQLDYVLFFFLAVLGFIASHGLSLFAVRGGFFSLRCTGFSFWWLLLLRSTAPLGAWASVLAARGLSSCGTWALEHVGFSIAACGLSSCSTGSRECVLLSLWCVGLVVVAHRL